jgi:hypothetical protein
MKKVLPLLTRKIKPKRQSNAPNSNIRPDFTLNISVKLTKFNKTIQKLIFFYKRRPVFGVFPF